MMASTAVTTVAHMALASATMAAVFVFCDGSLFGYHPAALALGFVFLMGEGVIAAAVGKGRQRPLWINIHALLQGLAGAAVAGGITAIYLNKERLGKPHFATLHSRLGLAALALFLGIAMGGAVVKYLPGMGVVEMARRAHKQFGAVAFFMGVAVCINGLRLTNPASPVYKGTLSMAVGGLLLLAAAAVLLQLLLAPSSGPKMTKGRRAPKAD
ncbi:hypothetical protein CLOM_g13027 [Closterium sp. NIES-68]|nr:hypothetical protein CLOM_g13027 [Closterium sp. NIES-68]GJP72167.1 hypothetical protein CLOP_g2922 [Closterium sp. NIES-67]